MFGVPDQIPSQPSRIPSQSVRVLGSPGVPSHGSESVSSRVGSFAGACNAFLPPNVSASWPSGAFHYHKGVGPQGHRQARATEQQPEARHNNIIITTTWLSPKRQNDEKLAITSHK